MVHKLTLNSTTFKKCAGAHFMIDKTDNIDTLWLTKLKTLTLYGWQDWQHWHHWNQIEHSLTCLTMWHHSKHNTDITQIMTSCTGTYCTSLRQLASPSTQTTPTTLTSLMSPDSLITSSTSMNLILWWTSQWRHWQYSHQWQDGYPWILRQVYYTLRKEKGYIRSMYDTDR